MTDRFSTQQAAEYFNVSERTIRRWIKENRVKAEQTKGRWFIHIDGQGGQNIRPIVHPNDRFHEQLTSENRLLRDQLAEKDRQIESLMQQLDHTQQLLAVSQKSIQQLTQQNQLLLEDKRRPLWRRLLRR